MSIESMRAGGYSSEAERTETVTFWVTPALKKEVEKEQSIDARMGILDKILADRTWTCSACNTTHDRDLLAANNIKRFAFAKQNNIGQDLPEFTPMESLSALRSRKPAVFKRG